jgi:hypothetical protein
MAERSQTETGYDATGQITSTGSANAYVVTISQSLNAYYQGMPQIRFKANFTCSGSSTVNIVTPNQPAGLGAVTLKKNGGANNLASGDIVSGGVYTIAHDGTNFQVLELNAVAGAATTLGGFGLTASGDRWGVIAPVGTDGVMEIGRYLDFHNSDADATDYAVRLETNGGTTGLFEQPSGGVLKRIASAINSTLAQGDILYYDGSNFVRLAPGTSGQMLQTAGAAANPAWASPGQQLLATGSASGAATADIVLTSFTAFRNLVIFLNNIVPATDDTQFYMRTSTNGGSSYDSGATDYVWTNYSFSSSEGGPTSASNGAAQIGIGTDDAVAKLSSDAGASASYRIYLPNRTTSNKCLVQWSGGNVGTSNNAFVTIGTGFRNSAADVDAVRFLMSSGNITLNYAVYGWS